MSEPGGWSGTQAGEVWLTPQEDALFPGALGIVPRAEPEADRHSVAAGAAPVRPAWLAGLGSGI